MGFKIRQGSLIRCKISNDNNGAGILATDAGCALSSLAGNRNEGTGIEAICGITSARASCRT
jgi:hypothetical protein